MQKEKIVHHHQAMLDWAESLREVSDEKWFRPIAEGKWSPAEIIRHFVPWDEFILEKRIPYFGTDQALPKGPSNAEVFNKESAKKGRTDNQGATIDVFVETRKQLIKGITEIKDELWSKDIKIGSSELSLFDYFNGLAEHDLHHKEQVKTAIH